MCYVCFFFFKQKTAYEMRISDWSSDVCSSDLRSDRRAADNVQQVRRWFPRRGGPRRAENAIPASPHRAEMCRAPARHRSGARKGAVGPNRRENCRRRIGRRICAPRGSALAGLEPAVGLVDYISAAAATDHAVVPMTVLERLQRIADLHVETLPIALVCQKIEGRQLWGDRKSVV